jgi:hypothetical protein
MLLDLLEAWDRQLAPGGRRVLAFAPDDAGPWFDARVPASFALQAQADGDLGRRMQRILRRGVRGRAHAGRADRLGQPDARPVAGHRRLPLPGAEGPGAGPGDRRRLLPDRLPPAGPADLRGDRLGHALVLGQTLDRLRDAGRSLAVLPPWYDVDTPDDWRVLAGHVRAMRRAGMAPGLPRVEALLPPGD